MTRTPSRATSRGVSKIVLLAIVAVILAVGGGVFILSQNGTLSSSLPMAKAPLNPNCKYNDPNLCKFLNNFANQPKSYAISTTSDYSGMKMESLYEIDGSDKFHMMSSQNGKESSNTISIGDTTYTLDYSDHKWWKETVKVMEGDNSDNAEPKKEELPFDEKEATDDKTTYKFIVKEACGDHTCFKYEVVSPDSQQGKVFLWFDDRDYLMRKMRIEASGQGVSESVYTYDHISITAPSPVKDGSPSAASGGSMPSDAEVQKMMKQYQQSAGSNDTSGNDSEAPVDDSSDTGF